MGIVNDITKSHWGFWLKYECIDIIPSWKMDEDAVIVKNMNTTQIFIVFVGRKGGWVIKPVNKRWGMPPKRYFNRVDNKQTKLLKGKFSDIIIEAGGNTCWRGSPSCHVSKGNTTWKFEDAVKNKATTYVALQSLADPFKGELGEWDEIESTPDVEGFCDYETITKVIPNPKGYSIFTKTGKFCDIEFDRDVDSTYFDIHFNTLQPLGAGVEKFVGKFLRYYFDSETSELIPTLETTLEFLDQFIKAEPEPTPEWANEPLDALVALCGKTRGRRIYEFRQKYGNFEKAEDLLDVHGVGRKLVEKWTNEVR